MKKKRKRYDFANKKNYEGWWSSDRIFKSWEKLQRGEKEKGVTRLRSFGKKKSTEWDVVKIDI